MAEHRRAASSGGNRVKGLPAAPRRRILLATAASLLLAVGARAAELSPRPPAPPYLGACGVETGGFRLPGTDGCLRINGSVAAEGGWALATAPSLSLAPGVAGSARGAAGPDLSRSVLGVGTRLSADVRLPTDYGPVRAYLSLRGFNGLATARAAR